jgi:hypothetical protein
MLPQPGIYLTPGSSPKTLQDNTANFTGKYACCLICPYWGCVLCPIYLLPHTFKDWYYRFIENLSQVVIYKVPVPV